MNTTRVNKDNWFHHIRCTDVTKIPIYNNLEQVGDEPGMEGDIILRRDTQEFCYHDGTTWICIKAGGEDVTLEDACLDGVSLVADGIGPTLLIKGLLAGTGITLQDGSCVTITNSEPASSVTLRDACDLCATGETSQTFFKVAGGSGNDQGLSVSAIVNAGADCVYVTGEIRTSGGTTRDFDGNTVTGIVAGDIFVAKLASDGTQVFFKVAGGDGFDEGFSVSAIVNGANDCVYVTGRLDSSNPRDFDGNTVTGYGGNDIFVAKLASDGTQVFFKIAGGTAGITAEVGASVSAIVNGTDDCVYVTGAIITSGGTNPRDFDGNTVTGYGGADIFVAKLASDGSQAFFKVAGGSDDDSGISVSAVVNGANDCVYVTGFINTDPGSSPRDFDGNTVTGYSSADIFVAKLASDGTQVFFKVAGGSSGDSGASVSAIVNGGTDCVYVTGAINTTSSPPAVDFDGNTVTGYGDDDIFVAKLASDGSQVFFKVAGGTSFDLGISVSAIVNSGSDCVYVTGFINTSGGTNPVDFNGNTVTGYGSTDIFVAKLASDGSQVFFKVAGGTSFGLGISVSAIVHGAGDCVYVTGTIITSGGTNPRDFDGNTVTGYGTDDIFLAKLASDGTQIFFKVAGGTFFDSGSSVSAIVNGANECVYVTGFINTEPGSNPRDFDGNTVIGYGSTDIFVAKLTTTTGGVSLVADGDGPDLLIKGLLPGDGITLSDDGSCVTISTAITLANACGTGINLVADGVGPDLAIKGLTASDGIVLSDDGSCVNIATDITLVDACSTGVSLVAAGAGPDLEVKGLIAGVGITLSDDGSCVTITNSSVPDSAVTLSTACSREECQQTFFKVAGGLGADSGVSVIAIGSDCVYVTGNIFTIAGVPPSFPRDFDGNTVTGYGDDDIFVAKLASDGTQVFFKVAGGSNGDLGLSVSAIVNGGNSCVYVTGFIFDSGDQVDFNGNSVIGYGGNDIFVAKLSSDGTQEFFKVAGGTSTDSGNSVSAIVNGANDCVYVTGRITDSSPVDFDGNSVTGYGLEDIFVAKLASDGTQLFFKVAGGSDVDSGLSVSAIVNGVTDCVYVTGQINTSGGTNPVDFNGNTVTGYGLSDIFVAKLASDGTQAFFKIAGGSNIDEGFSVSAIVNGASDCVYVTGRINTTSSPPTFPVDFDGNTVTGFGRDDIFVAKLASDGSQVFFKVAGGSFIDQGSSVSAIVNAGSDCVYVTGFIETLGALVDFNGNSITGFGGRNIFVAKLASNGTQAFFKIAGGTSVDGGNAVSAVVNAGSDCVYVTGFIDTSGGSNPVDFDGNPVTGYGGRDIFVAKLNSDGSQACFKIAGGPSNDEGLAVSAIVNGGNECVYITGFITTNTSPPPVDFEGNIVSGYGNNDIFVAKLTTTTVVSLVADGTGPNLGIKGLIAGDGIALTDDGSCVEIATAITLANSCACRGTGINLVADGAGPNLAIKGLTQSDGIVLIDDGNCVNIATAITLDDTCGTGVSLVANGVGPDLVVKGLISGDGITLSDDSSCVTITNTFNALPVSIRLDTFNYGAGTTTILYDGTQGAVLNTNIDESSGQFVPATGLYTISSVANEGVYRVDLVAALSTAVGGAKTPRVTIRQLPSTTIIAQANDFIDSAGDASDVITLCALVRMSNTESLVTDISAVTAGQTVDALFTLSIHRISV